MALSCSNAYRSADELYNRRNSKEKIMEIETFQADIHIKIISERIAIMKKEDEQSTKENDLVIHFHVKPLDKFHKFYKTYI